MNNTADSWYERQFARFYDRLMHDTERHILKSRRRQLLADIQGPVLEIGCGTGVNFELYPENVSVLAIDPSLAMLEQARHRAERAAAQIQLMRIPAERIAEIHLHSGFESREDLAHGHFASIVCCLVLCTVREPVDVLNQIVSLLKPGGRLLVLEHIRSHNSLVAMGQALVKPAWKCCGAGCVVNRATDKMLQAQPGLRLRREEYFSNSLPFYQAQFQKE